MANITRERLELELKNAKEQLEKTKADAEAQVSALRQQLDQTAANANVQIGVCLGQIDMLQKQLAFLEQPEPVPTPSAQLDQLDNHPTLRQAEVVADAAVA